MSPLPGFHEQIVAMSAKEDKNFVLNVPEDFPEAGLAGQQATVQVHLHAVKQQDLPPLDDELAIMVGDYDTLEALKAGARERLEADALQAAQTEYLEKALDAFVLAAPKIEYPPQAVDREVEMALQRMQSNLASSGIQFDMFLRMIGRSREAYQQELRPSAEERLKKRLVLESLARAEQLQVTPEEVEAELERMRTLFGSEAEEMMRTLHTPGGRLVVYGDLLTTKAQERAIQIAKGEAPPIPMPDATQNLETNQEQTPVDSPSSQLESQEIQGLLDSQESTETPVEAESNPQPETNS
jgi:trigger factor